MIRAFVRTLFALVITLALLIGGGWYLLTQTDVVPNTVTNTLLNSGVVTSEIENALRSHEDEIAQRLGMSTQEVDQLIGDLAIDKWEATSLPSGTSAVDELSFDYGGSKVNATVYDDPEYVTLELEGQEVTLRVPENARNLLQSMQ